MPRPFDLDHVPETTWPPELAPLGEDSARKESFDSWWERNDAVLAHLPPDLAEQWIHRHWLHSPFRFLPLEKLTWERRIWDGESLLSAVYRAWGGPLSPQFDYKTFQRGGGSDRLPTAVALDGGTWDFPMVLLATPSGVIDLGVAHPDARLVIVEGHQRHRYLNALHALDRAPAGPHETIILHSPLIEHEP